MGVSRPPLWATLRTGPHQRQGRPPLPDGDLVAAIGGISAGDVRDLMVMSIEQRFGQATELAKPIKGITDNGSCYTAHDTRRFARDAGLVMCTTPIESPQSNGTAEALVRTIRRLAKCSCRSRQAMPVRAA